MVARKVKIEKWEIFIYSATLRENSLKKKENATLAVTSFFVTISNFNAVTFFTWTETAVITPSIGLMRLMNGSIVKLLRYISNQIHEQK